MFKRIFSAIGAWLPDTLVRAVKTFGQAAVASAFVPASGVVSLHDWQRAMQYGATAAAVSVLNNLAGLKLDAISTLQTAVTTVQVAAPAVAAATFPQSPADLGDLTDDTPDDTGHPAAA